MAIGAQDFLNKILLDDQGGNRGVCFNCGARHERIFRFSVFIESKHAAPHYDGMGDSTTHGTTSIESSSEKPQKGVLTNPKVGTADRDSCTGDTIRQSGSEKAVKQVRTVSTLDPLTIGERATIQRGRVNFGLLVEEELQVNKSSGSQRGSPGSRPSETPDPLMIAGTVPRHQFPCMTNGDTSLRRSKG